MLLLAFQSPYLTLQTNVSQSGLVSKHQSDSLLKQCDDVTEIRQTPPTTSGYATTGDMGATVAMETNEENPLHGMKCCAPIEEVSVSVVGDVCVCGVCVCACVCMWCVHVCMWCVCECVCACVYVLCV